MFSGNYHHLIDPKGRGFEWLSELPHLLYPVVRETCDAIQVLNKLVAHMERRDVEQLWTLLRQVTGSPT